MTDWTIHRDGATERQIGARVPVIRWTVGVDVEEEAERQLHNVASLPFIDQHGLAVMPDVHAGYGATIGSVIPTRGAVIPMAVGSDIGCGVDWSRTNLTADALGDLKDLRQRIEAAVPAGFSKKGDVGNWPGSYGDLPPDVILAWSNELADGYSEMIYMREDLKHKCPAHQLGTLGSGNHFIEIVIDDEGFVGVLVHSGSRGPGGRIAQAFTKRAQDACKRWFVELPDPYLAYLPEGTGEFNGYMAAAEWAQDYAIINRRLIVDHVLSLLPSHTVTDSISCHHNYVAREHHFGRNLLVTRKGAIRARVGDRGIIPGSMGDQSFIVEGLGCVESYCSAAHGAGRRMSRNKARQTFTIQDHFASTKGVECKKDPSVLDETPGAYKDVTAVMTAQRDLVKPVRTLRQVVCVKG